MVSEEERKIIEGVDPWVMYDWDQYLSETIGSRLSGTEGDCQSIDWMSNHFAAQGLRVELDRFNTLSWEYRSTAFKVGPPLNLTLDSRAAYYSYPTPKGGVEGELVFVGKGTEEEFAAIDVNGKIAMAQASSADPLFWLGSFSTRARRHGAVAFVVCNGSPVAFTPSHSYGRWDHSGGWEHEYPAKDESVPCVTIGSTDAMALLHAVGQSGLSARIVVDCVTEPRDGANVRAFIAGTEKPEERVLIHAHRDDGGCSGANDNGSGTVCIMMLAQIMAKLPRPKRTIEFISTGSEEGISDGMVQYIVNREKEGTLLDAVAGFNIDMVGVGGPARIVDGGVYPDQPDHQVKHNKELNDFVENVGKEIGVHLGHLWGAWGTPEEGHLNEHGVPAMCIWKADDPNYHSDNEHVDNIDWNAVKAVAQVIGVAAWRVANDTSTVFPR
ncbi:MAG: M20/M25/M40 family metallo-hydrolase [Proteobacteria bacterium]|nr:M20/M25/M40 family metallo-hydrolase [Pseudomonadota bacterium]